MCCPWVLIQHLQHLPCFICNCTRKVMLERTVRTDMHSNMVMTSLIRQI